MKYEVGNTKYEVRNTNSQENSKNLLPPTLMGAVFGVFGNRKLEVRSGKCAVANMKYEVKNVKFNMD